MEKSNDLKLLSNKQKELEMKQQTDRDARDANAKEIANANSKLMTLLEQKDAELLKNRQLLVEFDSMSKKLVQLSKECKDLKLSLAAAKDEHQKTLADKESVLQVQNRQLKELSELLTKNKHEEANRYKIDEYRYAASSLFRQKIIDEQEQIISEKEREVKLCIDKLRLAIESIDALNDDVRQLETQLEGERKAKEKLLRNKMYEDERLKSIFENYIKKHIDKNKKILRDFEAFKKEFELSRDARRKTSLDNDAESCFERAIGSSPAGRADRLESSLVNLDLKLTQGLEMLKKDYELTKNQLNSVSNEVESIVDKYQID